MGVCVWGGGIRATGFVSVAAMHALTQQRGGNERSKSPLYVMHSERSVHVFVRLRARASAARIRQTELAAVPRAAGVCVCVCVWHERLFASEGYV